MKNKNTPHPNPHPAAYSVVPQGAREQEVSHFDLAAFVAQFPLFARAPNGIANLRALILQLAVQGKLTEQNADENAKITLNTIKNCQQNRMASQEIRQQKPLPKVRDDEKSFTIPSNWVWTRLNDWGVWGSGATPKRDHAALYGGNIPWFKSGELTGGIITVSEEYITEKALKESAVKLHLKGTVLLAMYGATIGKTAILGIDATTNQAVCGCQCYDGIFNSYLLVLLKAYNSYFSSQGAGGAQPNISREKIIVTPVPLPPLEEQQRIVAKVDELMALCDQLEAQQDEQARNLLEANTAVVQAVTKTPIPSPSPARGEGSEDLQLLTWQRIATHFNTLYGTNLPLPSDMRRGKLKDRTVALENIAKLRELILGLACSGSLSYGLRKDIPDNWQWTKIKKLANHVTSGSRGWKKYYATSGATFIRSQDIKYDKLYFEDQAYVDLPDSAEGQRTRVYSGDLLITITGANVGKVAHIDIAPTEAYVSQHVCLLRLEDPKIAPYLHLWLKANYGGRGYLLKESYGDKPGLNLDHIKNVPVPLPPLEEQHRIVAQVDELMALCDTLETLLTEQRQVAADFSAAAVQAVTV